MSKGILLPKSSILESARSSGVGSKLELAGNVIVGRTTGSAKGGVAIQLDSNVFLTFDLEGLTDSKMDSLCFPKDWDFDGVRYWTSPPTWKAAEAQLEEPSVQSLDAVLKEMESMRLSPGK